MKKKIADILFDTTKGKIKLNHKASIFFFCLLLSTFFWFLSMLSKSYTTVLTVPLQYNGVADNFIITEAPSKQIEIEVFGSGFDLLGEQLSLNQSKVEIDLNLARKMNEGSYGLVAEKLRTNVLKSLDKDLNLRRILTDSITFRTQKKISKELTVVPILDISYGSGFNQRGEIKVEPEKIVVSGPEEALEKLELVKTRVIKLSAVSDTVSKKVELDKTEFGEGISFSHSKVNFTIPVEKYTEKQILLPLSVATKVNDIELKMYPNEVRVFLLVPLSKYEMVNQDLLSARVNFDTESIYMKKLKVALSGVPEYAKLLRIEPEKVEFIVKK